MIPFESETFLESSLTGYVRRHDRYPMIRQRFDVLKSRKRNAIVSHWSVLRGIAEARCANAKNIRETLTSLLADSVCLTVVTADQLMNFVYNIRTNWSFENSWQSNGFVLNGSIFLGVNTHEWARSR